MWAISNNSKGQLSLISEDQIQAIIRPEENLERWSHFIFPQPKTKDLDKPRWVERELKLPNGESWLASIWIEPSTAHKAFTCRTYDVYLALVEIWTQRGKPETAFYTSMSEICLQLDLEKGGRTVNMLVDECNKLLKTNISWTLSYKLNAEIKTVKNQTILSTFNYSSMNERVDKSDQFDKVCEIKFHDKILQNLIENKTIPVNFAARKLITSPIAKVLYNQVDTILATNNRPYSRTAKNLVQDLQLTASRYQYKSQRQKLVEQLQTSLNGRRLGNLNILNVVIAETNDWTDWKCVFSTQNIKKNLGAKNKPAVVNSNKDLVDYLVKQISAVVGHSSENQKLYTLFARHYSENAIFRALGEFKEQIKLNGKTNRPQLFTAILHRIIHDLWYKAWIKKCEPNSENCKFKKWLF